MPGVRWIVHKNKKICHVVLTDITPQKKAELKVALDEAGRSICAEPLGSVLTLVEVTGSGFNRELNQLMREIAQKNKPFVKASAVVGATGLKRAVLSSIAVITGRKFKVLDSVEEAKEWLVGL